MALLTNDLRYDLRRDRLKVSAIGHVRIGHDRRRIGIDEDDPVSLLAQRLAGLGARIIEFASLADDDRPGSDDQDRGNIRPLGHLVSSEHTKKAASSRGGCCGGDPNLWRSGPNVSVDEN